MNTVAPLQNLPVAHTGHVIVDLLTFVPVVILLLWFVVAAIRDRRREEKEDGGSA
jgi:Na+/phosphate symporter